jgi:membrane protease YdiL (CAAX protease family)
MNVYAEGFLAYLLIMVGTFLMHRPASNTMYLVAMFFNGLWFLVVIKFFWPEVTLKDLGVATELYRKEAIAAAIFGIFVPVGILNIFEQEIWLKLSFFRGAPSIPDTGAVTQGLLEEGLMALILLVLVNGIIMAAIQESFFRGFLLRRWAETAPFWAANGAVSLLFWLFHWSFARPPGEAAWALFARAPGILLLSLLAGYLWLRWGLAAAVTGHVLLNFISSLVPLLQYIFRP